MKKYFLGFLGASFLLFSCNNDDDEVSNLNSSLNLDISGLEDLGSDYVYEGWIIVNGNPVSTGRFSVNSTGQLSKNSFLLTKSQLDAASTFVLTIEPSVGDDPAPSEVHILAGDFSGNSGTMTVSHAAAFGSDFSSIIGKYILATPTDGGSMDNEESGVWFLDNSSGSPVAGLELPTLPNGWKYEGWAVINGMPVSTGTFTNVDMADDNASTSPFKGNSGNGPAFPGEDFLQNAPTGLTFPTDLSGGKIVISIEPSPDNSSMPFLLKPLVHDVPVVATTHTPYTMMQNLGSLPTGSFTR